MIIRKYTLIKKFLITAGLIVAVFLNNACYGAVDEDETAPLKGSALIVKLKSDNIRYNPEEEQFVATGNVVINIEDQDITIKSEEVIFDQLNQVIIFEKNVEINKQGSIIHGDYARLDLTVDSALIGKPDADLTQLNIEAETAEIISEDIEMLRGKATINEKDLVIVLTTGSFGSNRDNNRGMFQIRPDIDPRIKYDIKAKEVLIEEYEYYNIITLKNTSIKLTKFPVAKVPVLQITTDREDNRVETMLPEFGHRQELGAYFGHGHVFHVYKGNTLKALPIFSWGRNSVGVGGMGRFMSRNNRTEVFYSTLKNKVVMEGEHKLGFISRDTMLQYGSHAYIDNGFFGAQRPHYIIEIVDDRKIKDAYNLRFLLRSSAGFAEETGDFSTAKFQLQGSLFTIDSLLGYKDYIDLGIASNFSIAAYGTGDAHGVVRAGPTLTSNLGPVKLWLAYYQGGIYGETPFLYDRYFYGRSNLVARGSVRLTKYLTLGYLTSFNLTKDNWNNQLVVENQVFAWVGPEELKFKIGYDVERTRTVFGFDMLLGSENSEFEFDKLKVIQK